MSSMPPKERDIQRNLKILKLVEETGLVGRTCRYFDIGRASFYRWKAALEKHGEAALVRKKMIPKNPTNRQQANPCCSYRKALEQLEALPR